MTQELLKELFEYKEDGHFYWKIKKSKKINIGKIAGCLNYRGYREIRLNGKLYREHRLIWFYHNGVLPINGIDHINAIKDDNRIENLREATQSQNNANNCKMQGSSSKYKGVSFFKRDKKWSAQIVLNKKQKHLGYFDEEYIAAQAYNEAALKSFGEFARINKI